MPDVSDAAAEANRGALPADVPIDVPEIVAIWDGPPLPDAQPPPEAAPDGEAVGRGYEDGAPRSVRTRRRPGVRRRAFPRRRAAPAAGTGAPASTEGLGTEGLGDEKRTEFYGDEMVALLAEQYPLLDAVTHAVPFPLGVAELDDADDPRIVFANDAAGEAFGRSFAELYRTRFSALLGEASDAVRAAWVRTFRLAQESGTPQTFAVDWNGRLLLGTAAYAHTEDDRHRFVFFFTDESETVRRARA